MNEDRLEAGPELDALVAVEVMGWQKVRWRTKPRPTERAWRWAKPKSGYYAAHANWSPSIDWADAGEVLKVAFPNTSFTLHRAASKIGTDTEWLFSCKKAAAEAPAGPLAICRAALKAVRRG